MRGERMHRTNRVPRAPFRGLLLLSLVFGGFATVAQAQDEVTPPPKPAVTGGGAALIVPINGTQRVQMKTGKRIRTVINERDTTARVTEVQGDPSSVLITGLAPGTTKITLTDIDGKSETIEVIVQF